MDNARSVWTRAAAVAAPIIVAANFASAACLPGNYDTNRGVQLGDCYTTPEINKAMKSFGQTTLVTADRIAVGNSKDGVTTSETHNRFTASEPNTKGYSQVGFNVEGNAPTGSPSTEWRIKAIINQVHLWDNSTRTEVTPEMVGALNAKGIMVGALNAKGIKASGDRLVLSGTYNQGHYVLVSDNAKPTTGSFLLSNNSQGAGLAILKNIAYTKAGAELLAKQQAAPTLR